MPYSYSVSHVAGGLAQGAATDVHGAIKDDELFNFASHGIQLTVVLKDPHVEKKIPLPSPLPFL